MCYLRTSAENATTGPRGPLEWGQINFIHTTDTHGWLEGHLKEQNYHADISNILKEYSLFQLIPELRYYLERELRSFFIIWRQSLDSS